MPRMLKIMMWCELYFDVWSSRFWIKLW
jgi:hypothetical protein